MIEGLVILACISGKGCNESLTSYYVTHPSLVEYVERNERDVKKLLNPYVIEYILPMAAFITNTSASFRIYNGFSLVANVNNVSLNFKREW
jgi:hypothetical protein